MKPLTRAQREHEREAQRMADFYDDTPIEEAKVSPEDVQAFMDSLACDSFKIDPHSRFCEECGFARSDHRKRAT